MSTDAPTLEQLRRRLVAGEIDRETFLDLLEGTANRDDKDGLWATWAAQGQFDAALEQDGFTSFAGNRVEEVGTNGERER
jgi:hypothetical protein